MKYLLASEIFLFFATNFQASLRPDGALRICILSAGRIAPRWGAANMHPVRRQNCAPMGRCEYASHPLAELRPDGALIE
jgi:hypothetical protein